ncbi:MAG TPA: hypothetical protein VGX70_08405, partial [Gemmataceae bacterium]|nr:hypothetical protein [Gemmataceae bacterium]
MNHWSIHSALAGVLMLVACDNKETEWKIHLAAASEGVDRLVVEPLLMSDDKKLSSFEIKGADKIKSLIELIEIDAAHSGYSCNCDGDHRFRFYKGDMLVLTLHYLHGNALRWPEGKWKGDALLTEATQEAMPLWFRKRGFPALQEMRESRIAQMKREEEERTRFVACFPEKARAYFQPSASSALDFAQSDERSGQKLAESIADSEQVALAVCRAFGTLAGQASSWSSTSDKERRALAAIQSIKGDSFLSALEKLKGDRQALLGAARMFFWEQFNEKLPMEKRAEWSVRLAKVTLTDGWDGNKPITLWRLGLDDDSQVMTLLRDVFRGKVGKEMDSPKAGNQEPGLRASAAVILAQKDDQSIKEDVKQLRKAVKLPQDIAACDVALAIFGDPSCIKKEYFRFESYTIGLGELRAIENFKGTHGMEALVKGAIHHPWGRVREEAENTFARIVGKKLDAEEIEAWWEEHQVGKEAYTAKRFKGL